MSNDEEGLLIPKTVVKRLGVGASTAVAVATLVFAIAGGTTRADDRLPILGGTKHQILSDTHLDQVHGSFVMGLDLHGNTYLRDGWGFTFYNRPEIHPNVYEEGMTMPGPDGYGTLWYYEAARDTLMPWDNVNRNYDRSVELIHDRSSLWTGNSRGGTIFSMDPLDPSVQRALLSMSPH